MGFGINKEPVDKQIALQQPTVTASRAYQTAAHKVKPFNGYCVRIISTEQSFQNGAIAVFLRLASYITVAKIQLHKIQRNNSWIMEHRSRSTQKPRH